MAKKTIIQFVDDIDGKELGDDAVKVKFAIGRDEYEMDVSPKNAEKFYDTMEKCWWETLGAQSYLEAIHR